MITRTVNKILAQATSAFNHNNISDVALKLLYCYATARAALDSALPTNIFSRPDTTVLFSTQRMLEARGIFDEASTQVFSFIIPFSYMSKREGSRAPKATEWASQLKVTLANPFDPNGLVIVGVEDMEITTNLRVLDQVLVNYEHPDYYISFQDAKAVDASLSDLDLSLMHGVEDLGLVFDTHLVEGGVQITNVKSEPEVQEPEVQEPEVQEPEVQEPEVQEPEVQEPEVQEPEVHGRKAKPIVLIGDLMIGDIRRSGNPVITYSWYAFYCLCGKAYLPNKKLDSLREYLLGLGYIVAFGKAAVVMSTDRPEQE